AATALGHWLEAGVLALPSLLLLAEQDADETVQKAAELAAQSLATSLATMAPEDQPWLLGADKILRGQRTVVPKTQLSKRGRRALAELLMMAQWQTPERLHKLLAFTAEAQPDLDMVGSVYSWLSIQDAP